MARKIAAISLAVPGVRSQGIIGCLQQRGIYVSAGSACAKGHRSHTLTAMKLSPEIMDSSFRISLSRENTMEDVVALLLGIRAVLEWNKG